MVSLKKVLALFSITVFGALCVITYWNSHLYYKAEKTGETERKIEILERAVDIFPSNDLVFYELGRAYFDLAANDLSNRAHNEEYLHKSVKSFQKSLRSNPASYFGHFNLAQALLYLDYFFPSQSWDSLAQFKKAASLAGENSLIFFEVSKIFLSQWSQLSDADKDFALEILKKIASRKDKERILSLLHVWEMNVRNYSVIEKILPEDQRIYRIYADFLAEKSLSLEARQRSLAKAEFLEFERAKEEYKEGEQEFYSFRMEKAFKYFHSCLKILRGIRFYQTLAGQNLIDFSVFKQLEKSALLYLVKCTVEQRIGLKDVEDYLVDYLTLELDGKAVGEVDIFLRKRGLIRENLKTGFNDDLSSLYFELMLRFHQSHYREIMQLGRHLKQSFVVIPEDKKKVYARILNLIGDSYQKINYVYDAGDFYQKALEMDPGNLETLIRLRLNYEKLGADEEIQRIDEKIEEILAPKEILFKDNSLEKGRGISRTLVLDGRAVTLVFHFDFRGIQEVPLISIFFNGRVVWEDYLKEETLSLSLDTNIGKNSLRIVPLNRDISLVRIAYH